MPSCHDQLQEATAWCSLYLAILSHASLQHICSSHQRYADFLGFLRGSACTPRFVVTPHETVMLPCGCFSTKNIIRKLYCCLTASKNIWFVVAVVVALQVNVCLAQPLKMDPERPEYHRCSIRWSPKADAASSGGAFIAHSTGVQVNNVVVPSASMRRVYVFD